MDAKNKRGLPTPLERLRRRFDEWRRVRKAHARIPDALWDAAVRTAGTYGISRTANVLRVNYPALKKRLDRKTMLVGKRRAAGEARFVELPSFGSVGSCDCFLELSDGTGATMRVRLRGVGTPDLAALGRSFWDRDRDRQA
jgi:hypothetical protein